MEEKTDARDKEVNQTCDRWSSREKQSVKFDLCWTAYFFLPKNANLYEHKNKKERKQEEALELQMDAFSAKQMNYFFLFLFFPPLFLVDNERIDC